MGEPYGMREPYGFYAERPGGDGYPGDALIDAANEAIDLRAEVERLRELLAEAAPLIRGGLRWRIEAALRSGLADGAR